MFVESGGGGGVIGAESDGGRGDRWYNDDKPVGKEMT